MKKLEKLTLKELNNSIRLLNVEEASGIKGGDYWFWSQETGWIYMLDEVTVIGSYDPVYEPISSQTTTFCDYSSQGDCDWAENTAVAIIGAVPVLGDLFGIVANKVQCERSEAITKLLQANIECNDTIRMDLVVGDTNDVDIYYDVYDSVGNFLFTTK